MSTIKSYTDVSQSKKLAEILPIESADMFYPTNSDWEGKIIGLLDVPLYIGSDGFVDTEMGEIHAWSLAALLDVVPYLSLHKTFSGWCCDSYNKEGTSFILGEPSDNPVDACYEMIIKLHELKML